MNKISIIIPAFNEQVCIEKAIEDTILILNQEKIDYEIIVVNDGSTDKTKEIIDEIEKKNYNLKVINNEKNFGKGFSVRKGCLAASGDIIGFMDADSSVSVEKIREVISVFEKNKPDLLIGSRKDKGGIVLKRQVWYRDLAGRLGNILIKFLLGIKINDTQCGFKFFSQKLVKEVFPKLLINGWLFDVEIIKAAQKNKYKIEILPIEWVNMGESKVSIRSYIESFLDLIMIIFLNKK